MPELTQRLENPMVTAAEPTERTQEEILAPAHETGDYCHGCGAPVRWELGDSYFGEEVAEYHCHCGFSVSYRMRG